MVRTAAGDIHANAVVFATGAYQRPHRPAAAKALPVELPQIDVDDYRNEQALPPGKVLIIGSGQSGCQIAEELREAGRDVIVACGRAPWAPRRFGGRDLFWWAQETGFLDGRLDSLSAPEARLFGAPVTGHGRGPDLHLRTLQARGVTLTGHFLGATDRKVLFAPDLDQSVAWGRRALPAIPRPRRQPRFDPRTRTTYAQGSRAIHILITQLPRPRPHRVGDLRSRVPARLSIVAALARCLRQLGIPAYPRRREHGSSRAVLRRGPLLAQAEILAADWCR